MFYLLVSQHRVQVELYTREADGRWTLSEFNRPEDRVPLPSVDCNLALSEIYDKVEWPTDLRPGPGRQGNRVSTPV